MARSFKISCVLFSPRESDGYSRLTIAASPDSDVPARHDYLSSPPIAHRSVAVATLTRDHVRRAALACFGAPRWLFRVLRSQRAQAGPQVDSELYKPSHAGRLIHADIAGSFVRTQHGGFQYLLVLVDDH
eukprot:2620550-Pleurochrysis_carterae.AAC.4